MMKHDKYYSYYYRAQRIMLIRAHQRYERSYVPTLESEIKYADAIDRKMAYAETLKPGDMRISFFPKFRNSVTADKVHTAKYRLKAGHPVVEYRDIVTNEITGMNLTSTVPEGVVDAIEVERMDKTEHKQYVIPEPIINMDCFFKRKKYSDSEGYIDRNRANLEKAMHISSSKTSYDYLAATISKGQNED